MRILVAEHDPLLGSRLEKEFEAEGVAVDLAPENELARSLASRHSYDVAVIDIDARGACDLLQQVRTLRPQLAIVILATGARPGQRTLTFESGADDFVLKPFEFPELLTRVQASLRSARAREAVLRIDNLELSRAEHVAIRDGRRIRLTPKEFALLEYLLANAGEHVSRSEIVRHVWHQPSDPLTNIVDVYVNYLRKKVDVPFESKLIHTVRGVGYQLGARKASGGRAA